MNIFIIFSILFALSTSLYSETRQKNFNLFTEATHHRHIHHADIHYADIHYAEADPFLHIVFDLDKTLLYDIPRPNYARSGQVFSLGREVYRLSDYSEKIIGLLAKEPRIKISFFSGREEQRNKEILKKIKIPGTNKSFFDIAFKILSRPDLTDTYPRNPPRNVAFHQRYKKDLLKITSDLNRIILVDDHHDFTPPSQEKNVLWLGRTYKYFENFQDSRSNPNTLPRLIPFTYKEWYRERHKIVRAYNIIQEALRESSAHGGGQSFSKLVAKKIRENPYLHIQKGLKSIYRTPL